MCRSDFDGHIAYDFEEFCKHYGNPQGKVFTVEVTHDAVTYVYGKVVGIVRDGKVIFELSDDLGQTETQACLSLHVCIGNQSALDPKLSGVIASKQLKYRG